MHTVQVVNEVCQDGKWDTLMGIAGPLHDFGNSTPKFGIAHTVGITQKGLV